MAPRLFTIIILVLFLTGILITVYSLIKYKYWSSNRVLLTVLLGIIVALYASVSFKHLIHYNLIKTADNDWLNYMFMEYVKKYNKLPKHYSDLQKSTSNAHELFEKDFFLIKPNIKFKIRNISDTTLKVIFYETGYDQIDDELKQTIDSPASIWGINIRGDFLITESEFKIDSLQKSMTIL